MYTKKKLTGKTKMVIGIVVIICILTCIYATVLAKSETLIKEDTTVSLEQDVTKSKLQKLIPIEPENTNTENNVIYPENFVEPHANEPIIEIPEPEEPKIVFDTYSGDSNIKCSSNLTAEQIDILLEGTDLHGIGQAVYEIEEKNGINAFFTISVASLESGYGSSALAKNKNNLFGMLGCSFKSRESCVRYFGELINDYEYNHNINMTPNSINTRYCTESKWKSDVVWLMNHYVEKARSNEW